MINYIKHNNNDISFYFKNCTIYGIALSNNNGYRLYIFKGIIDLCESDKITYNYKDTRDTFYMFHNDVFYKEIKNKASWLASHSFDEEDKSPIQKYIVKKLSILKEFNIINDINSMESRIFLYQLLAADFIKNHVVYQNKECYLIQHKHIYLVTTAGRDTVYYPILRCKKSSFRYWNGYKADYDDISKLDYVLFVDFTNSNTDNDEYNKMLFDFGKELFRNDLGLLYVGTNEKNLLQIINGGYSFRYYIEEVISVISILPKEYENNHIDSLIKEASTKMYFFEDVSNIENIAKEKVRAIVIASDNGIDTNIINSAIPVSENTPIIKLDANYSGSAELQNENNKKSFNNLEDIFNYIKTDMYIKDIPKKLFE